MHSEKSIQKLINEERKKRFHTSIDVSSAMDNCFFHCIALYLLANHLAFPPDLFVKTEFDPPVVCKLKDYLSDPCIQNQLTREKNTNHLFDKILILGILLRSWFAQKRKDADFCNFTFNYREEDFTNFKLGDHDLRRISFLQLVKNYQSAYSLKLQGDQDSFLSFIEQVSGNSIYQSNRLFFEKSLNLNEQELYEYWKTIGYDNYCRYLNNPVKITYADVDPILKKYLPIPYAIYNQSNGGTIVGDTDYVELELILDVQEGHYKLLTTETTNQFLTYYIKQKNHYLMNREHFLKQPFDAKNSIFIKSTLPPCLLAKGEEPLSELVRNIPQFLRTLVDTSMKPVARSANTPLKLIHSIPEKRPGLINKSQEKTQIAAKQDNIKNIQANNRPRLIEINTNQLIHPEIINYYKELLLLQLQINELRKRACYKSAQVAESFYETRHNSFATVLNSKTPTNLKRFEKDTKPAILEKHRGRYGALLQVLGNVLLAFIGFGIFYGIALCINKELTGRYLFFAPKTAQLVSKINKMAPKVAAALV